MPPQNNFSPLIATGLLLGSGLGGFADGIVLHQILQWHNMLSARIPPRDLVSAKINMYWDGLFHAAVWVMTVIGIFLLWRVARRPDVPWSGRTFLGSALMGWALFNIVEGVIDHQILGIHHVYEYTANPLPWDLTFLGLSVLLLLVSWLMIQSGKKLRPDEIP